MENIKNDQKVCRWEKYIYETICPKYHDIGHPYWMIPKNLEGFKYCPYCGKEIVVED